MSTPTTPNAKAPLMETIPMATAYYPAQPNTPITPTAPPERSYKFRVKELLNQLWIWEALSCVVSVIFYLAIMMELKKYNGSRYGEVGDTKTSGKAKAPIFPILSFLSAIMKAAMLMPVASAISQSKWIWFRKERKLAHMDRFDEASRGIIGSLRLLFTIRFMNIAAIGALLTIFSLPMDAFIQSSVQISPKRIINQRPFKLENNKSLTDQTYLARTTQFTINSTQVMTTPDNAWPQTDLINGIKFGISYMSGIQDAITANMPVQCPTGICDFGRYQTLGVESMCIDRSKEIMETRPNGFNYTLPGTGLTLRKVLSKPNPQGLITAKSTNNTESTLFPELGPRIVRTTLLINVWDSGEPVAMDCMLYWRVRTRDGFLNITSGLVLEERRVPNATISWTPKTLPGGVSYSIVPDECWVNNTKLVDKDSKDYENNCVYFVGYIGNQALQRFLLDDEDGLVGDSYMYSMNPKDFSRTNHFITNVYELAVDGDQLDFTGTPNSDGALDKMFNNIAYMMTNTIRNTYREHPENTVNPNMRRFQLHVNGTIYQDVFFYHVLWTRLALPSMLVFGSIFFFILTAIANQSGETWKRSSLPLLFHGLGTPERIQAGEPTTASEMLEVAKNMNVKLAMTGEGMRMVGHEAGRM
ncbi:hypothetical protein BGZ60DRAFT_531733 [Tricladium varicosporioides]|nr:hypothetical protein BGZ60DRAFT_531733 [Hymenoscyphus varicosporioides]